MPILDFDKLTPDNQAVKDSLIIRCKFVKI